MHKKPQTRRCFSLEFYRLDAQYLCHLLAVSLQGWGDAWKRPGAVSVPSPTSRRTMLAWLLVESLSLDKDRSVLQKGPWSPPFGCCCYSQFPEPLRLAEPCPWEFSRCPYPRLEAPLYVTSTPRIFGETWNNRRWPLSFAVLLAIPTTLGRDSDSAVRNDGVSGDTPCTSPCPIRRLSQGSRDWVLKQVTLGAASVEHKIINRISGGWNGPGEQIKPWFPFCF